MKVYYDPKMFPNAPEECVIENAKFIKSDINRIVLTELKDEEDWEDICDNPSGFFDYVSGEIYERFFNEEMKTEYANCSSSSYLKDVLEHVFVIVKTYFTL